jgi:hypothetical protein
MSRRIETGPPESEIVQESAATSAVFVSGPGTRDVVERAGLKASPSKPDGYLDRLLKYIPAEIIALYLGVTNVIPPPLSAHVKALWIVTAISTICVPVYMYFSTEKTDHAPLWPQIAISSVSFPLWVFAIGGPFSQYSWYDGCRWIAAITICFATFLFGLYRPAPAPLVPPAAAKIPVAAAAAKP